MNISLYEAREVFAVSFCSTGDYHINGFYTSHLQKDMLESVILANDSECGK